MKIKKIAPFFLLCLGTLHAQSDSTLYRNDFSNPATYFPKVTEKYGRSYCAGGKFHTEYFDTSGAWSQIENIALDYNDDFTVETSLIQTNNHGTDGFGIVYGRKDYNNTNYFLISSSGYFIIYSYAEGAKIMHQEWKYSAGIKGPGKSNYLAIKRKGSMLYYYINDAEVASLSVSKIKMYGLSFGFQMNGKMTLDADYFNVLQKKKKINLVENWDKFGAKERLGPNINSEAHEKHPVISPDGKFLYVNREGHPGNKFKPEKEDIWVSELQADSTWGPLKNIGSPLNNESHNATSGISADNMVMLIGGVYSEDLKTSTSGYSITYRTKNGWGNPKKLEIDKYSNSNEYASATLSADSKVIILSAEREDSYGESDLYVCFRKKDNTWSEPLNLGAVVNTSQQDYTPYLSSDGVTLYFSSYGHPGYGSADIFMVKRLDDSWLKWSKPQNLGPKFNTKSWDAYFSIAAGGKYAYIGSNAEGAKTDVYRIELSKQARPEATVLLHGIVSNDKTKAVLGAEIKLVESGTTKVVQTLDASSATGEYAIIIKKPGRYDIAAVHEGFISIHKTIEIKEIKEYKEYKTDLALTPVEKGATIVLKNIFFVANKYDLLSESYEELNKLVVIMKENPGLKIEVSGHTSKNNEGDKFNEELSTNRALAVKNYLVTNGVDASRITHKGYGFSKPLYKDEGQEHQALNRRVEFTILAK